MKILVVSDSHGRSSGIAKVLKMHQDAHYLIHLGDGIDDLKDLSTPDSIQMITVNGNREDGFFSLKKAPPFSLLEVLGKKLFICHGHRYNVNHSMQNLYLAAKEQDADIALFGHTHFKHNEYVPPLETEDSQKGIYLFNPGSISAPRDDLFPSFGLIDIRESGILLSHGIIRP